MKIASSFFVFALAASLGSAASAGEYIIGEGVNPDAASNKPRLTVKVDGQSGGKTFSPDEASGMTVACTIDVSGANQAYCSTGYHVYYSDRLSLTKNKLGNINVVPGADQEADNQALAFTNNNAPKEDPTAPEGWKGFFVSTAGNGNVGLDGTMWKFSFELPDDLQGGEVFPIDILYKVADSAADMFASASPNSAESKNMEAYLFTKGIYTASNPNPFGVEGLPADADGYIAIAVPPPVVSNVVARQRWPWNGLVDVDYEIGGETKGFKAEISFDEQGGRHWVATNFLAGAEPTLNLGRNRATWDAKAAGVTNVIATNVIAIVSLLRMPIVDIASGMYADAFSEVDFTTPNESNYFINEDTLEAYRVPTENSKGDVQTIASLLKDVFRKNDLSAYSGFKYANGYLSLYKSFSHLDGTDDTVSTETFEKAFAVTSAMADTDFKQFAGLYEDVQDYINNGGSYDKLTFKYKSDGTATLTQSINIDKTKNFNAGNIANLDVGDILSMLARFGLGYTIGSSNASDISYEHIAEAAGSTAGQVNSNSREFTEDQIDAAIEIKRVIDEQYATIDQADKNTPHPVSFKLVSISGDDGLIIKYTSTETEERSFPDATSTGSATYKRVADAVLTANDYTNGYVINGSAPAYVFKNKDMYGKSYYVENDNLKKTFKGDVEKTVNFLKAVYPDETRNITFDPNAEYTMEIEQNGTIKLSHNGLEE